MIVFHDDVCHRALLHKFEENVDDSFIIVQVIAHDYLVTSEVAEQTRLLDHLLQFVFLYIDHLLHCTNCALSLVAHLMYFCFATLT